ncbi:helix-turn-helix transcriptional regulator [Streptomyces sp. NPDC093111]|uniref:helix-turn-helix transcriptional regulator n=1 Tax=Streptomyces sp. NPDC093111 TaxID=3154978 RepID=UPI00343FBBC9
MTTGERAPDPREARNPAEFIARLQALKDRSGLTYRELSARAEAAGDVLPRSTVANMLARSTLPREELLAAFVRACGIPPEAAEEWETVRAELAVRARYGAGADAPPPDAPDPIPDPLPEPAPDAAPAWPAAEELPPDASDDPDPEPPSRLRRALVGAVAVAGLVLATVSVVAFVRDDDPRPGGAHRPVLTAPAEGPVHIRVIGSDLCLNERRGSRDGQIYQRACAGADVPRYELKRLGGDRWRIVSVHPDFPVGCSGIPSGGRIPDAALEDSECGDPTRVERFALEPHGTPVTGYRIVPADSATPGSCVTVAGDRTAEWSRLTQAPCTTDARGQLFSFDRR